MTGLENWVAIFKKEGIDSVDYLDALALHCEDGDVRALMRRLQQENSGVVTVVQATIIAGAILRRRGSRRV